MTQVLRFVLYGVGRWPHNEEVVLEKHVYGDSGRMELPGKGFQSRVVSVVGTIQYEVCVASYAMCLSMPSSLVLFLLVI